MKAYIFVEKEQRPPKKGEWAKNKFETIFQAEHDYDYDINFYYTILERHEVEVDGKWDYIKIMEDSVENNIYEMKTILTIPITKPKVKKWKWEIHYMGRVDVPVTRITDKHYTEQEMRNNMYVISERDWHKVEGSEIEVEE